MSVVAGLFQPSASFAPYLQAHLLDQVGRLRKRIATNVNGGGASKISDAAKALKARKAKQQPKLKRQDAQNDVKDEDESGDGSNRSKMLDQAALESCELEKEIVRTTYIRLRDTMKHGNRHHAPSSTEISSASELKQVLVRVFFLDGTWQLFPVDPHTTVGQLNNLVCEEVGLELVNPHEGTDINGIRVRTAARDAQENKFFTIVEGMKFEEKGEDATLCMFVRERFCSAVAREM